jgi:hypothetical protein
MALLRGRRYAWLPVVFWFWANLHGAVLLGVLLLGAGLVAVLVEEIDAFPRLLLVSALCVLATALTPLGWQFWLDMPRSLGRIRQLGIDEWAAPRLASLSLFPFWVAVAALAGLTATRGRALLRDPIARREGQITMCACALVLVPLALTAVRNVPPFLMLAVPALAALLPRLPVLTASRSAHRPWLNGSIATAAVVVAATVVTSAYVSRLARFHWTPLPAASIDALNGCHGNVYNRYDEGGYLIWFAPGRKVFLDGRQQQRDGREGGWIRRVDAEEQVAHEAREHERPDQTGADADERHAQAVPQDEQQDAARRCPERHPDSQLARALRDQVGPASGSRESRAAPHPDTEAGAGGARSRR